MLKIRIFKTVNLCFRVLFLLLCSQMLSAYTFSNESVLTNDYCETIVLLNGDVILASSLKLTETDIQYSKCDDTSGATFIISRKAVLSIKHPDGSLEKINNSKHIGSSNSNHELPMAPNANLSMVLGIVGSLLFTPLAIVGLFLGLDALKRIKNEPGQWRGEYEAKTGVIIGAVWACIWAIAILVLIGIALI
jgi:Domain of unknown function (DUF4190)